jgi:predicted permease
LTGAGLLLASFRAVLNLDYGFDPAQVATANISLPATAYKDGPALVSFESRMLEGLRAIPGVEAAGAASSVPFSNNINNSVILAEGYVMKPGESLLAPTQVTVSSGYFEAMHIAVVRGRSFEARDTAGAPTTAIIDERLARKFWPDQDAVGRRLYSPDDPKDLTKITDKTRFFTIVGVVKEAQMIDPKADFTPVGTYYFPMEQSPQRTMTLTVRTKIPSTTIQSDVRRVVAGLDSQLPVYRAQPMQQWIDDALVSRRLPVLISIAFGVVALLLSAIGIYGVLAYGVAQRRRELGVRMALGGTSASVFGLVLSDGLKIVAIGLAIGLASSVAVGQLMKSQLFGVAPLSPMVLALVTLALSVVALTASAIPALRASRINPIVVLGK